MHPQDHLTFRENCLCLTKYVTDVVMGTNAKGSFDVDKICVYVNVKCLLEEARLRLYSLYRIVSRRKFVDLY